MSHSTVTTKGQTTIPGDVRSALNIKAGDRLTFSVDGDRAIMYVQPGIQSLKGALASNKGKGMNFAQIREAATRSAKRKSMRQPERRS